MEIPPPWPWPGVLPDPPAAALDCTVSLHRVATAPLATYTPPPKPLPPLPPEPPLPPRALLESSVLLLTVALPATAARPPPRPSPPLPPGLPAPPWATLPVRVLPLRTR